MIDDDRSGSCVRRELADDAEHIRVRTDAQRDDVAQRRKLGRRRSGDGVVARELLRLRRAAVGDRDEQAGALQVPGHGGTHRAQSDESYL